MTHQQIEQLKPFILKRKIKSDVDSCFKNNVCDLTYSCSSTDSCSAYEFKLGPGVYKLEVWGAKGGDGYFDSARPGGLGGYSYGEITITKTRTVFAAIGGQGMSVMTSGKVNGGNNGGGYNADSTSSYKKSSGGGATDIRLDINNLNHRIIVAGGGGGGNVAGSGGKSSGGQGGGLNGGKSPDRQSSDYAKTDGNGGTQTEGGSTGTTTNTQFKNSASQTNGEFGLGGNIEGYNVMGGPGGGGWFGGAAGNGHGGSGGGGSGFTLNSSTASNAPSSYAFLESNDVFLKNCDTVSGVNNGNGYARITIIKIVKQACFLSNGKCYATPFLKKVLSFFLTTTTVV